MNAEIENSGRKYSALASVPNEDGNVDIHVFKLPSVLKADMENLTARYASKAWEKPTDIESTGQDMGRGQLPKFRPSLKPKPKSSFGWLSTPSRLDKMDFQCRGLEMNPEHQPGVRSCLRYDTDSSAYYATNSGRRTIDSVVKRQVRIRSPTDELYEVSKKVTWSM